MNVIEKICKNCDGDYEAGCNSCPNCVNCMNTQTKKVNRPSTIEKSKLITQEKLHVNYAAMQIVSAGIRSDNVYEAKVLLAPQVDLSSIKITVKEKNLRVTVYSPFNKVCEASLTDILAMSGCYDAVKTATKHCINFLVPDTNNGDKVRAMVDDQQRLLILTAPSTKSVLIKRKAFNG